MGLLDGLIGGLVDKKQLTHDTIQDILSGIAEKENFKHTDFMVMIKPKDEEFSMRFYIYKIENGQPKLYRELTLEEIEEIFNNS
jgi:hypothetical protein